MNVQVLGDDEEEMLGGFADVFANIMRNVGKVASNVGKVSMNVMNTPGGQALVATAISRMSPTQKATLAQVQAAQGMTPMPITGVSQTPVVVPTAGFNLQQNLPLLAIGGAILVGVLFMVATGRSRVSS